MSKEDKCAVDSMLDKILEADPEELAQIQKEFQVTDADITAALAKIEEDFPCLKKTLTTTGE